MLRKLFITFLVISLIMHWTAQSVLAASNFPAPVFYEVTSMDSALNLVTAATGNDRFERDFRNFFKTHKLNLANPFVGMEFDGNKIRFEGLSEPILVGASPYDFTYKGTTYTYNPKKSTKSNFEEMKKVWGQFKELNFPVASFSIFMNTAHADVGPMYSALFLYMGVTAALALTGITVAGYFGYKWYKNSTEPLKMECSSNKFVQSKGKDRLVIEIMPDGKQTFYSEVNGRRELQGDLEKITLRGKDSYAITNGNDVLSDLRTASTVELNKKLMVMKSLCGNPEELEFFNSSSRRIQEAFNSGKIKITASPLVRPSSVKDSEGVAGVR